MARDIDVIIQDGGFVCESAIDAFELSISHDLSFETRGCDDIIQDGDTSSDYNNKTLESNPVAYYFHHAPVFCESTFTVDLDLHEKCAPFSTFTSFCDESGNVWHRPCGEQCCGDHLMEGCRTQLNPCVFFDYCFGMQEVDSNASFIFQGISQGFRIVDDEYSGSYYCPNYQSILTEDSKAEMNKIISEELNHDKVSLAKDIPICIHAVGAIKKSDGSIRPITDCKRPLGQSINNYIESVCEDFTYISLDDVCLYMTPGCYFSVLDIKSAYRSVNIFPDHRRYQGFLWDVNGYGIEQTLVDNCLCFGLKSAPYLYTQITEFIMRTISRLGYPGVFGYLDDFIVVSLTEVECKKVMSVLIDMLQMMGFVVAWKKVVIPSQKVTYLGITLDSLAMTLSLP